MSDFIFKEILTSCRELEEEAAKIYQKISEQTGGHEQKVFWHEVSLDEKGHVAYWKILLTFAEKGTLRNVFDDPDKIRAEIRELQQRVDAMLHEKGPLSDTVSNLLLAFRLESFMVNPVFAILFHVMPTEINDRSPEDDYQGHIQKFVRAVDRFAKGRPELSLIGEILSNMWAHNRELVTQFDKVKTLKGMIPICAACKKIRDDQGYWNQIESYLREHTEATFSHGICPECAKRLYPKYYRELQNEQG